MTADTTSIQDEGCPKLPADDLLMPFTNHSASELAAVLRSIINCSLPVEVFDAFLADYAANKDLERARFFASCEWDC